ncbi:MAG TPA: Gfo/Idh/MocA family oxidoreductase, partial [Chthonomonadaceae bacterium]|nr:Gfo/Idh/MocA family oxidoreductase [Chthonomonadaceae bacterium]
GGMGGEHLKLLARRPDVRIAGVCDEQPERAERAGAQFGAPAWTDVGAFVREAGLDVVHVCSPSGRHGDHGLLAAEQSIHVLCEKPLDLDLAKVDRLITLCERKGVRLGCIFQKRMSQAMRAVHDAIAAGRMGRILSCSIAVKWWRSPEYYEKGGWKGTRQLDGGAFANQGIHSLDLMVWMAGPAAEVEYACLKTIGHEIETEDFGIAVVRFGSGARGTIEITTCCRPDLATRLEIYGTNGSAAFDDARVTRFGLDGRDCLPELADHGTLTGGGSDPFAIDFSGHEAQIDDFYTALATGRPHLVDGREARMSVDLLTKIYAKARLGFDEEIV